MRAVQLSPWGTVAALAVLVVGLFLTMGYGIIGFAFAFVLLALGGGALMSWIDSD